MAEMTATWVGPANNQANSHQEQGRSPAAERALNALSAAGLRGHTIDCCVFSALDLEACSVADAIFNQSHHRQSRDLIDRDLGGVPVSRIVGTFLEGPNQSRWGPFWSP
eukprot:8111966-Ditylum_brightwellii.AAC.1